MMTYEELGEWLRENAPKGARVAEVTYGYRVSANTVKHLCGRLARYGHEISAGNGVWFRRQRIDGRTTWVTSSYS